MTMRTTRQTTRVKQKPGLRAYLKARRAACWGCCWKKKRRHDTDKTPPPGEEGREGERAGTRDVSVHVNISRSS